MIELFFSFLSGTFSFFVSGIDDLIVLFYFYLRYPNKFKFTFIGTFLGLFIVIIISIFFENLIHNYILDYLNIIVSLILIYIIYLLFKLYREIKNNTFEDSVSFENYSGYKIIISSCIFYILNGTDDFILYTSFLSLNESSLSFILGIYFGLILAIILIKKSNFFKKLRKEK